MDVSRTIGRSAVVAVLAAVAGTVTSANVVDVGWAERVPLDRLIRNVGAYAKTHPRDARAVYTLGRLHSIAFADPWGDGQTYMIYRDSWQGKPLDLPYFSHAESVRVARAKARGILMPAARAHLRESIRLYRRAIEMQPDTLYLLGCAWLLEQGAQYAKYIGPLPGLTKPTPEAWRAEALRAYRWAYALDMPVNLATKERDLNGGDKMIGVEAGEGIVRLLKLRKMTAAENQELARVKRDLKAVSAKIGWISPILLSLRPDARLADLLAPGRIVTFDLAATGSPQRWPWVRRDAGILVWDPERKGRIESGGRLFGSRTWQMFWRNGYEALAALDDNRDGWLSGKELAGIAVWFDRNGNGRSDPGEVVPVADLGIVRIAVTPSGEAEGVPANSRGIELRDGAACPTYDWTPRSVN